MKFQTCLSALSLLLAGAPVWATAQVASPVAEIPTTAEAADHIAHISGDVTFAGCTSEMRENIERAMALILDRFDDPAYLACLRNSVITEDQDATPERMLARLAQDTPTEIICHPAPCGGGALGCAGVSDGAEVFTLLDSFAETAAPTAVAGVIVHEVAHRKNFGHPGSPSRTDYPFTIPTQAARCISSLNVNGLSRSMAQGDTELAMFGGPGGAPFQRRCPSGGFVTGMRVDSAAEVNRIAVRCGPVALAPVGEERGTTRTEDRSCPAGQVAIGLRMRADKLVSHLAMVCAALDRVAADDPAPVTSLIFLGGEGGDPAAARFCPTGMAIKGLRGRSGARIDRIRVMCEDVNTLRQPAPTTLALVGEATGKAKSEYCLGHGVVTTLYGHSGGSIDRLGVGCQPTAVDNPALGTAKVLQTTGTFHALDWNGGDGGRPFALPCENGQVAVGIDVRRRQGIDAVRTACANINAWRPGSSAAPVSFTRWTGHPDGSVTSRLCPRGAYLAGLENWAKKTVHAEPTLQGIRPVCRAISYAMGLSPN